VISSSAYDFDEADAVATDGTNVWVTNYGGDSVTELTAATGALVQVNSSSAYGFDDPDAVATDGTNVWVTNAAAQSVTGFPVA
jgi:DNA-binding beta-propeller fold protein YncE